MTTRNQRLANPSGFPGLEIEFYHGGETHCVSLERAKRLAEDLKLAIQDFEESDDAPMRTAEGIQCFRTNAG